MKKIGQRLKTERQRLGLTLKRLADVGGVTLMDQHRYELGDAMPRADYLAALVEAGVDVVYVVTGKRQAVVRMSLEDAQVLIDSRVIGNELFQGASDETIYFEVARPKDEPTDR